MTVYLKEYQLERFIMVNYCIWKTMLIEIWLNITILIYSHKINNNCQSFTFQFLSIYLEPK